jgi:heme oxygenase
MLHQLDYATRGHHVAADAGRMGLLRGTTTRAKYVEYLARTYAFEAPVEARWRYTPGLDRIVDVMPRLRTGFLAVDLRTLGYAPDGAEPASFVGIEQTLGWMYVVERGRRLNAMLHRLLQRRLANEIAIAGNYLLVSTPAGNRWHQLGEALDRYGRYHASAEQIINAAHRAFRALRLTSPAIASRAQAA